MSRQTLVIQLLIDGRAAWQIKQDVPRELCRKMSQEELTQLGTDTVNGLGAIIRYANPVAEPVKEKQPVAAAEAKSDANKKKR